MARVAIGECSVCGRNIYTQEALAKGMGARCARKQKVDTINLRIKAGDNPFPDTLLETLAGEPDIICERTGKSWSTNVAYYECVRADKGMRWGSKGAGAFDLAWNACLRYVGVDHTASPLATEFRNLFIAKVPKKGGRVAFRDIADYFRAVQLPLKQEWQGAAILEGFEPWW